MFGSPQQSQRETEPSSSPAHNGGLGGIGVVAIADSRRIRCDFIDCRRAEVELGMETCPICRCLFCSGDIGCSNPLLLMPDAGNVHKLF